MDALRAAVPLARLFLAVADAPGPLEIRVRARARLAQVRLEAGRIVDISGVDAEPLGDALLRLGSLDAVRHRAAFMHEPPQGKVGAWLVETGAATPRAVQSALQEQLGRRMAQLLRWAGWSAPSFERVASPVRAEGAAYRQASVDLTWAVWNGLLALSEELPPSTCAALAGERALKLTRSGARLASALACRESFAFSSWLLAGPSPTACAPRAVLRALGAVVDVGFDGGACRLLLRKQREIRRSAGPRALLDLPPQAQCEQARPALRRLARTLHPDRFQANDPALGAASHDVMQALSRAESELLASPPER